MATVIATASARVLRSAAGRKKAFLSLNGKNDITPGSELIAAELWLVSQNTQPFGKKKINTSANFPYFR